ncbi:MATE family efflux transporter [bacterium]|nr:MATE family efflux transporter [bacterium]
MNENNHPKGGIIEMLLVALPMFASMGCDAIMTFTDRIFLSRLSPDHMNASLGGGVYLATFTIFFTGLLSYSTALVAQYLGAGFKSRAAVTTFQAILIALISYPILLITTPIAKLVFQYMDIPANQLPLQIEYFSTLLWGSIFLLLRTALSSFFSGLGRTKFIMIAAIASLITNVVSNYLLIFGKFGFPQLGIRGAAIGTNIGAFVGVVILFMIYFSKKNRIDFQIMRSFKFNPEIMKKLLWYGLPQGFESFMSLSAFTTMILLLHSEGEIAATASTIMFNWDYVSFMPLIGIQIAVTSLVGKYMGARDIKSATKVAYSGVKTGLAYSAIIFLLYVFSTDILVNFFKPAEASETFNQAFPMAKAMLRLATVYVLADAVTVAFVGVLRGAGDTHWTMFAFIIMHWLAVANLFISLKVFNASPVKGWGVLVFTFLSFSLVLYRRFKNGKWKTLDIIRD